MVLQNHIAWCIPAKIYRLRAVFKNKAGKARPDLAFGCWSALQPVVKLTLMNIAQN